MEQISFFMDIGAKEPPMRRKDKKRPIPEDLPDSAKKYFAERTAKECRRAGLSTGDKRSMENKIYAWLKEQDRDLTAHQIAVGMCLAGIHYSEHRQSVAPRLKGLEERGLIEKTGKKVFDKETGASAGTYRIVEV
ncbi:hypothetical protein [Anaerostipes sp. AF04-45]|uniref:hypothetical protein n=1 Tax=Anaerostipes sp. AF04-45 TaxID=2292912 RepID=UPI000E4A7300|nr:hypothetical protein [Anaerostipes sp. AF04-45]RGH21219.1 hypothetical protein DWV34_15630 [Anaerostipes sp. AF04-45]